MFGEEKSFNVCHTSYTKFSVCRASGGGPDFMLITTDSMVLTLSPYTQNKGTQGFRRTSVISQEYKSRNTLLVNTHTHNTDKVSRGSLNMCATLSHLFYHARQGCQESKRNFAFSSGHFIQFYNSHHVSSVDLKI